MIRVGDRLPEANLWVLTEEGPAPRSTKELFGSRKTALFGVPAAFTRVCSGSHLPGFIARSDDFKAAGCDAVVCIAVNDPFVVSAWAKQNGADGIIEFYGDGNREFTAALGLENDASARGQGIRSKRYSMLIDKGIVTQLNVEDVPAKAEVSGAETLLAQLREGAAVRT
jgi:glutaredoxin/glutathione-dependent peroxiredoxin